MVDVRNRLPVYKTIPDVPSGYEITEGKWYIVKPDATVNLVTNPSMELGTTGWNTTLHFEFYPIQSTDDAFVDIASGTYSDGNDLRFGVNVAPLSAQYTGIRFRNIVIDAGATILTARLKLVCNTSDITDTCQTFIYAQDDSFPAAFSDFADFAGRPLTAASVAWGPVEHVVVNQIFYTDDFNSVVQEVINRGDWASGNNLVIFINGWVVPPPYTNRIIWSYNSDPSKAPILEITVSGVTISQSSSYSFFGAYSLKVIPDNTLNSGVYYSINLTLGTVYTASAYVLAPGIASGYMLQVTDSAGASLGYTVFTGGDSIWKRVSVTFTASAGNPHRVYIRKSNNVSTAPFYVDGLQVEEGYYMTTFCAGDQLGCTWNGAAHASTSVRKIGETSGGRLIDITDYVKVIGFQGTGMAPVKNVSTPYALLNGALYQRTVAQISSITLALVAQGSNLQEVERNRNAIINLVKPDRVGRPGPVYIHYIPTDNCGNEIGDEIYIAALYADGLAGDISNQHQERIPLQFASFDPFWKGLQDNNVVLDFTDTVANAQRIAERDENGDWTALGTGMTGTVNALVYNTAGDLYAGGAFALAGGIVNTDGVARWDGTAWNAMGTGVDNNAVLALAMGLDGTTLYAGGTFTTMGGIANTVGIAEWSGAAPWIALGVGVSAGAVEVDALAIDPSTGYLYVGGAFSLMNAVANTVRIAYWDSFNWYALSTGIPSTAGTAKVLALVFGRDGKLYIGGSFTTADGGPGTVTAPINYVASWDGTSFGQVGSLDFTVQSLTAMDDGSIIAADATNGKIARWNGTVWEEIADASTALAGKVVAKNPAGLLYSGGNQRIYGNILSPTPFAIWSGYGKFWNYPDIKLPGTLIGGDQSTVYAFAFKGEKVAVGWGYAVAPAAYNAETFGQVTVNYTGTAEGYPTIKVHGPGNLMLLRNETTGKIIYFGKGISNTGLLLNAVETVTLTLERGNITLVSDVRGNLINGILPTSDVATFALIPGDNVIQIFILNSTGSTTANLTYVKRYWSIDGVSEID